MTPPSSPEQPFTIMKQSSSLATTASSETASSMTTAKLMYPSMTHSTAVTSSSHAASTTDEHQSSTPTHTLSTTPSRTETVSGHFDRLGKSSSTHYLELLTSLSSATGSSAAYSQTTTSRTSTASQLASQTSTESQVSSINSEAHTEKPAATKPVRASVATSGKPEKTYFKATKSQKTTGKASVSPKIMPETTKETENWAKKSLTQHDFMRSKYPSQTHFSLSPSSLSHQSFWFTMKQNKFSPPDSFRLFHTDPTAPFSKEPMQKAVTVAESVSFENLQKTSLEGISDKQTKEPKYYTILSTNEGKLNRDQTKMTTRSRVYPKTPSKLVLSAGSTESQIMTTDPPELRDTSLKGAESFGMISLTADDTTKDQQSSSMWPSRVSSSEISSVSPLSAKNPENNRLRPKTDKSLKSPVTPSSAHLVTSKLLLTSAAEESDAKVYKLSSVEHKIKIQTYPQNIAQGIGTATKDFVGPGQGTETEAFAATPESAREAQELGVFNNGNNIYSRRSTAPKDYNGGSLMTSIAIPAPGVVDEFALSTKSSVTESGNGDALNDAESDNDTTHSKLSHEGAGSELSEESYEPVPDGGLVEEPDEPAPDGGGLVEKPDEHASDGSGLVKEPDESDGELVEEPDKPVPDGGGLVEELDEPVTYGGGQVEEPDEPVANEPVTDGGLVVEPDEPITDGGGLVEESDEPVPDSGLVEEPDEPIVDREKPDSGLVEESDEPVPDGGGLVEESDEPVPDGGLVEEPDEPIVDREEPDSGLVEESDEPVPDGGRLVEESDELVPDGGQVRKEPKSETTPSISSSEQDNRRVSGPNQHHSSSGLVIPQSSKDSSSAATAPEKLSEPEFSDMTAVKAILDGLGVAEDFSLPEEITRSVLDGDANPLIDYLKKNDLVPSDEQMDRILKESSELSSAANNEESPTDFLQALNGWQKQQIMPEEEREIGKILDVPGGGIPSDVLEAFEGGDSTALTEWMAEKDIRPESVEWAALQESKEWDALPTELRRYLDEYAKRQIPEDGLEVLDQFANLGSNNGGSMVIPPEIVKELDGRNVEPFTDWLQNDRGKLPTDQEIADLKDQNEGIIPSEIVAAIAQWNEQRKLDATGRTELERFAGLDGKDDGLPQSVVDSVDRGNYAAFTAWLRRRNVRTSRNQYNRLKKGAKLFNLPTGLVREVDRYYDDHWLRGAWKTLDRFVVGNKVPPAIQNVVEAGNFSAFTDWMDQAGVDPSIQQLMTHERAYGRFDIPEAFMDTVRQWYAKFSRTQPPTSTTSTKPTTKRTLAPGETTTPPFPLSEAEEQVVTVMQTLGCTALLGILSATALGYLVVVRDPSIERFLHLNQEVSLLVAHVLIITMRDKTNIHIPCKLTSIILQSSFLTNFTFMAFEAFQAYTIGSNLIPKDGLFNRKQYFVMGWVLPFVYSGVSATFFQQHYVSWFSCWLNLGHGVAMATMVPVMALSGATVVMVEASGMDSDKYPVIPGSDGDQRTASVFEFNFRVQKNYEITANQPRLLAKIMTTDPKIFETTFCSANQKGLLFVLPACVASWFVGLYAVYEANIALYGMVFALNLTLAVSIFTFHTLGNPKVRLL